MLSAFFLVSTSLSVGGCSVEPGQSEFGEEGTHFDSLDAGGMLSDAGAIDGGSADSGTTEDGGTSVDAGTPSEWKRCSANYAGCTTYEDRTAPNDDRSITFVRALTPRCLRIKVGQAVVWNGPSITHPLDQSCGAEHSIRPSQMSQTTVTFNRVGFYGYFCENHGTSAGTGMAGSIEVVP